MHVVAIVNKHRARVHPGDKLRGCLLGLSPYAAREPKGALRRYGCRLRHGPDARHGQQRPECFLPARRHARGAIQQQGGFEEPSHLDLRHDQPLEFRETQARDVLPPHYDARPPGLRVEHRREQLRAALHPCENGAYGGGWVHRVPHLLPRERSRHGGGHLVVMRVVDEKPLNRAARLTRVVEPPHVSEEARHLGDRFRRHVRVHIRGVAAPELQRRGDEGRCDVNVDSPGREGGRNLPPRARGAREDSVLDSAAVGRQPG
mmetsp:Transcript_58786/g.187624  ORF Transcript_58786/g.187624 Transcript_58786/m.187624 type:complete len:261 (-) Transcript_58786:55-837(-)